MGRRALWEGCGVESVWYYPACPLHSRTGRVKVSHVEAGAQCARPHSRTGQVKSSQVKSSQVEPNETTPRPAPPCQATLSQAMPRQAMPSEMLECSPLHSRTGDGRDLGRDELPTAGLERGDQ